MSELKYPLPDLSKEHFVLTTPFRIGDSVAVMLLRHWIEQHVGRREWYLAEPNSTLNMLDQFRLASAMNPWTWHPIDAAPEDAEVFNECNLWVWNDYFCKTGHRMEFGITRTRHWKIVFAPLLFVDYAPERAMHPMMARSIATQLQRHWPGDVVILGDRLSVHDLSMFRDVGAPVLVNQSLQEAANIIGNADLFIGGDTGLSHIAGCFSNVHQIALHDRTNTEGHTERDYDHIAPDREYISAVIRSVGQDVPEGLEYHSFPNKSKHCSKLLFDNGGFDGETLTTVLDIARVVMGAQVGT